MNADEVRADQTGSNAKYSLENGEPTTADNPERMLWHGCCSFWTDDWSKVVTVGSGIPVCPTCKRPGFQIVARKWFEAAEKYAKAHPGYLTFLGHLKDQCHGQKRLDELFAEWKSKMITCEECGTVYEPITDAYKCPACGTENYPEDDDE
jgi:Zn finger protein HypA/HybF involved in hydrogenase expression